MKRCPKCEQTYADETLNFCLEDGEWLVPVERSEGPVTAVMPGEDATRRWSPTTEERTMSSAEYIVRGISRNRSVVIVVALFVAMAVAGFAVYKFRNQTDNTPRTIQIDKLTTEGKAESAAISPDGKEIVFSVNDLEGRSLWRQQVTTLSKARIVPPDEGVDYAGIQFTPDGDSVTFLKRDRSTSIYTLYQMSTLGGTQKKLITDVDGPITYSPDGKQFSFIRGNHPGEGESSILIANADGSEERILAQRRRPESFPWWDFAPAAWAPDGKTIACIVGGPNTGGGLMDVAEISVEDGGMKPITKKGWYQIKQMAWMPDKSGLLVMGAEKASDYFSNQIWYLPYPDGEPRRVTNNFDNYLGISLAADGRSIAAVQGNRISNIWIVPNADASRAVQIKAGGTNQEGTDGLYWAPDRKIVFYSKASGGHDDIWIMNEDGSGVKQLTVDAGVNYDPVVTPDGRYIVFASERSGQPNTWRMDMDGGNVKQLTFGTGQGNHSVTPDSKWVFFDSLVGGKPEIWKVSIDGGEPVPVTHRYTENSEVSPDGRFFASEFREGGATPWKYALFNIEGGEPIKVFDLPGLGKGFRWAPDSRSLHQELTNKGVANIWSYPLDGSPPKQVTDFKNDQIFNFRWSPDGKSLVVARGTVMSDVVLIRDFR